MAVKRVTMVTMDDIARHAGVSRATVSYVLNKRQRANGSVSDQTRARVLASASALNYRTNELARAMVTGKSRVLGVLTTPRGAENTIRILTGAIEAAEEKAYLVKVVHLSFDTVETNVVARCQEWRLAGVIAFSLSECACRYLHGEFARVGMPFALIDNAPRLDHWGVRVRSDDAQGVRLAISHLLQKDHTRIGFLGGSPSTLSQWREENFRDALAEAGVSVSSHWIRGDSWTDQERIERDAHALLSDPDNRPTAIVCSADTIAMVVLRVARSLGLRVPGDLSVTGYSNASLSAFADPPLTTVDQSLPALGREAALHLIARAQSKEPIVRDEPAEDILIPTRLIERASTAPCPPREKSGADVLRRKHEDV